MSNGVKMENRLENIIAAPIPQWVIQQLTTRSNRNVLGFNDQGNPTVVRSNYDAQYLENKSAWVRVISSVDLRQEDINYFNKGIGGISSPSDLAKKFILYGGVSAYKTYDNGSFGYDIRSGIGKDGAYGILGNQEVVKYGYKPMPGIESAKIETTGRLGSIRSATISFKVWDKDQLDIIDTLYFKLGYTMFIEWGNTFYVKAFDGIQGDIENLRKTYNSEDIRVDPFAKDLDKDGIRRAVSENVRKSNGNYDAMWGIVTNFDFSFTEDGGYDCTLTLIGPGVLGQSIRINSISGFPDILKEQTTQLTNTVIQLAKQQRELERRQNPPNTPPGTDANAKPWQETAYPLCIRKSEYSPSAVKPGITERLSEWAIVATVNNSKHYFYTDYRYQVQESGIWVTRKYECRDGRLYLDGKSADQTVFNYFDLLTQVKQENKLGDIKFDSNKQKYYLVEDFRGVDYLYINKLKKAVPLDEKYDISVVIDPFSIPFFDADLTKKGYESKVFSILAVFDVDDAIKRYGLNVSNPSSNDNTLIVTRNGNVADGYLRYVVKDMVSDWSTDDTTVEISYLSNEQSGVNGKNPWTFEVNYEPIAYSVDPLKGFDKISSLQLDRLLGEYLGRQSGFFERGYVTPELKVRIGDITKFTTAYDSFKDETFSSTVGDEKDQWKLVDAEKDGDSFFITVEKNVIFNVDLPTSKGLSVYTGKFDIEIQPTKMYIPVRITINDPALITDIKVNKKDGLFLPVEQTTTPQEVKQDDTSTSDDVEQGELEELDPENVATEQALKYRSTLEVMLRSMQLKTYSEASEKGLDLTRLNKVFVSGVDTKFFKSIYSQGLFTPWFDKLIGTETVTQKQYDEGSSSQKIMYEAMYGFHSGLMSNKQRLDQNDFSAKYRVNYKKLFTRYIIPYQQSQDLIKGSHLNYPVYITLGHFLAMLNHACTLYAKDKADDSGKGYSPLIYIDFNVEANLCLSTDKMLTTNPYQFFIPFEGTTDSYRSIFPSDISTRNYWKPDSVNPYSIEITKNSPFRLPDSVSSGFTSFRGKIMNVLVSIDYLLDLVSRYSTRDETNTVYLKSILEQTISDMNKSFGNFNIFRLGFNDYADTFFISDDQVVPSEGMILPSDNKSEIPLYGVNSIAQSLNIKTEISTKLANIIAISANSESDLQATSGKDGSDFGAYNTGFKDRYKPVTTGIAKEAIANQDNGSTSQQDLADQFNEAIENFYSVSSTSEGMIDQATNYYIERMAKVKNADPGVRASAMIPVSLNFTTDGISGLNIGQSFTIDQNLLPYTYQRNRTLLGKKDHVNTIGFVIVGLDHELSNNRWITSVRGNMIFLKSTSDYSGSVRAVTSTTTTVLVVENAEYGSEYNYNFSDSEVNNFPTVTLSAYPNIKFGGNTKIGNPANDKLNPKLLRDIDTAAANSGITPTITTGDYGHSQGNSRHSSGNAVDIAIINGQGSGGASNSTNGNAAFRDNGNALVAALESLGYIRNVESGNPKAVLWQTKVGGNHYNHIHVSNRT